jgi:uncharacterized membrane protein
MPKTKHAQSKNPPKPSHSGHLVQTAAAAVQFQGPLPLPQLLEGYENVVPGSAERIIRMAEDQQGHRFKMENKALTIESVSSICGIIAGFIIGMTTVIGGIIVAMSGREWSGFALGGTGLAALAGVFVYGTQSRRKEREERVRQMRK